MQYCVSEAEGSSSSEHVDFPIMSVKGPLIRIFVGRMISLRRNFVYLSCYDGQHLSLRSVSENRTYDATGQYDYDSSREVTSFTVTTSPLESRWKSERDGNTKTGTRNQGAFMLSLDLKGYDYKTEVMSEPWFNSYNRPL
jgi:hypothetical protein